MSAHLTGDAVGQETDGNRPGRFGRSSWLTLVLGLILIGYQLLPVYTNYTIPTDGWALDIKGDPTAFLVYLGTRLSDAPSPLRQGDQLLAVDGQPVDDLLRRFATFSPSRPPGWTLGGSARYTVLRDGRVLDLDVSLTRLPGSAFLANALSTWHSPWLVLFLYGLFLPGMVGIGILVFWLRPRELAAQALFIISVCFLSQLTLAPFTTAGFLYAPLSLPYGFLAERWTGIIVPSMALLGLAFPVPKRPLRRHAALSLALLYAPWLLGGNLIALLHAGDVQAIFATWVTMGVAQLSLLLVMVGGLIHSFRTVRGATPRAQLKWFTLGVLGFAVLGGLTWLLGATLNIASLTTLFNYFGYLFLPVCLAVAITRYRLFDIDVVIRRTLVYALLTGLLALVYLGSVLLLQSALQVFGSQQSSVAIVLSTLLSVALFSPLRRQLQAVVDRRFYRSKYDAARALQQFANVARDETDLEALAGRLEGIVHETMKPASLKLWLHRGTPAATRGENR